MTQSDGIRNTGVIETQTSEEKKDFSHRERRGYREPKENIVIEGGISAGIGAGDSASEKQTQVSKNDHQQIPRKPNLSPEQQEWLNRVFIPNFRRELMKNLKSSDMKSAMRKTPQEVHETKMTSAAEAVLEHIAAEKDKTSDEALSEAAKEHERLTGIIAEMKIDRELVESASRQNSVNPSQVARLLKSSVRLNDEMSPIVLDDNGEPAVTNEGRLMTIDELVGKFLEGNPHFVRATSAFGGSGATGAGLPVPAGRSGRRSAGSPWREPRAGGPA